MSEPGLPYASWPGDFVELPAGPVHVRRTPADPDAEPAIFVHGLGGSATNWTDLMAELSDSSPDWPLLRPLACEAIDLPGFGASPPRTDGNYTINSQASTVIALIEREGRGPVHLVGNSMGGAVVTRVAARRPDLVRTITLISPALPDLRLRQLPMRVALASVPGIGPLLLDLVRKLPAESRVDRTIRDLYRDPSLVHPLRREEQIADVRRRDELDYAVQALLLSARSLVGEYLRHGRGSLWWDASRTAAPALVLHGSHDRLVSPLTAAKAARSFRRGRIVVLPSVGHVAMMERPTVVAMEMRAFLDWVRMESAVGRVPARPAGYRPRAVSSN